MFGDTIIYVTDQRQKAIANYLVGRKRTVDRADKITWDNVKRVILPTPVSRLEVRPFEKGILKANLVKYKPKVYGGAFDEGRRNWLIENQIEFVDTAIDELVVDRNAVITAEAVIGLITLESSYSITDSKIMVTGFGHCSRAVAERLLKLGAKVTIAARSKEARIAATKAGFSACPFAYGPDEAYSTNVLINTVPALVVTEKIIKELPKDALIIDIASGSGGCDRLAIEKLGINFNHALSLPGRYMTESSGKILADCINRHEPFKASSGEVDTWIYQIIP